MHDCLRFFVLLALMMQLNAACNYSNTLVHGVPPSDHHFDLSGLQSKSMQPANACSDLNMAMDVPELVLQRTMIPPVTLPTTFLDSSFDVIIYKYMQKCKDFVSEARIMMLFDMALQVQSASVWDTAAFNSLIHNVEFHQGSESALSSQSLQGECSDHLEQPAPFQRQIVLSSFFLMK